MADRVLVTYASRTGFTREIAELVRNILMEQGLQVTIAPVQGISTLKPYRHVVLGSAIRMGKLLPEVDKFVRRFKSDLESLTTAYFVVCLTMKEDTPDNRCKVEQALEPLMTIRKPVSVGLFPGGIYYNRLGFPFRFIFARSKEPGLAEGDFRDIEAVRVWAEDLASKLAGEADSGHGTHQ